MALVRIKFNNSAIDAGAFSLSLNPSSLELNDSNDQAIVKTLDGSRVTQNAIFDGRPIVLKWVRIPQNFSNFSAMIATLQSYTGLTKFVNFGDVDYRITGADWTKVKVSDLKTTIQSGMKIKLNVDMILHPIM